MDKITVNHNQIKTITLDFDDFSLTQNNMFYLEKLRELYPRIKISMFYIPVDAQHQIIPEFQKDARKLVTKAVKDGWIELIPHGLTHIFGEFQKASYEDMELTLKAYKEHFKELNLPYVHGFKAPNWLISKEAIDCLNDNNWFLAIDRNQPDCLKAKRNYVYNWDIADKLPANLVHIKGHGHISLPSRNNLPDCIINLSQLPQSYVWKFVSELMKEK